MSVPLVLHSRLEEGGDACSACFLCGEAARTRGVLCEACAAPILDTQAVCAEQVVSTAHPVGAQACLIDQMGGVHPVGDSMLVGREAADITVYSVSISRRHAILCRGATEWTVEDLGSSNGTWVDRVKVEGRLPLRPGSSVRFADVGFLFALGVPVASHKGIAVPTTPLSAAGDVERAAELGAADSIRLLEPTRGGGGLVETGDHSIQVTMIQFALISLLVERREEDRDQPDKVRGFVPSVELLAGLPWSAHYPQDAHLKQVVRRLRKRLADTALDIEGRRGFGYRVVGR